MERFFKKRSLEGQSSSGPSSTEVPQPTCIPPVPTTVDSNDIHWDPFDRKKIEDYHPNQRDDIRRKYLTRGPSHPKVEVYPIRMFGKRGRKFNTEWYAQHGGWLEYSEKADEAFCLCCYLFKDGQNKKGGGDAFVTQGFSCWNKPERLFTHVGDRNSSHSIAFKKCGDLMRQNQSIATALHKQSEAVKKDNRYRINASIDTSRVLLKCALPFRGHDESELSLFRGNFLEILNLICEQNENVRKVTGKHAPGNNKMVAPCIQKDIAHYFAQEVLKSILEEIGDEVFALLVDESSDVSKKEQMAVVLRYVSCGIVKESFIGLVHVKETSASSLKSAIDSLFSEHGLSLTKIRGQGYDGASNMSGQFNGLKAKILGENTSAYYVHCFAHQLQLVVVAVAKKHHDVGLFFDMIAVLTNVVCASCKRTYMIRENQRITLEASIGQCEFETGSGLNQELSLTRAGDTRWNSHYKTLLRLVELFSSIIKVLEYVEDEGLNSFSQRQASGIRIYLQSFDFVFHLHLMLNILGLTNILSQALQRKDQDIVNAITFVKSTITTLKKMRDDGFDALMLDVTSFCEKNGIQMLNMEEVYVNPRNRRHHQKVSNHDYYKFFCFNMVLDMQNVEFGDRFCEKSSQLLICMTGLNPHNSFCDFDESKLRKLIDFYPQDFSYIDRMNILRELSVYPSHMQQDERFANLKSISDLAKVLVETKMHLFFPLIYRLVKLTLVLPVATATVERCFSAMKLVKSDLRNRIADEFLNDCLICAVEREAFSNVTNESIIKRYVLVPRRDQL